MRHNKIDIPLGQQRFCNLLTCLSPALSVTASTIWQALQAAYHQPQRKYHTLQHIGECLNLFDNYRHLTIKPLVVEFALWFHDAVYQPERTDNEQQSAAWAMAVLQQGQVSQIVQQQVYDLIMATAHQQPPETEDEKLLVDIDLAILAASPARFAQYQQQIRAEYAWVVESIYQHKRLKVLNRLYNGGNIYHHLELKVALELAARINLQNILAKTGISL